MSAATPRIPAPHRWLRVRLCLVASVMGLLLIAIGYKAFAVQIRDGARMSAFARAQHAHQAELPAPRGTLLDVNGTELAISVDVDSVWADPSETVDPAGTARRLAPLLGVDAKVLLAKLSSPRRFVWLRRRISPATAQKVRALAAAGIALMAEPRRYYPGKSLAGPVLGFAGLDGRGLDGLELRLDEYLVGKPGVVDATRDARGDLLVSDPLLPAQPGAAITLTIDRFIQFTAERALASAIETHSARAGIAVVLDARTAAIRALASWPTFDPNDPATRGEARNRAVTDVFEPGSTMKLFTIAAALEAGAVAADDTFEVDGGQLRIGRKVIRDTHFEHAHLTVGEVLKFSSNVGAVKIVRRLGRAGMAAALRRMGFAARTGVELPGERAGQLRDPALWKELDLATIAFGYGMTATPIQLAAGLAAVAGDGIWRAPHLVERITHADGRLGLPPRAPNRVAVSPATARTVRGMLAMVMEPGGTGEKLRAAGYTLAGKTGTSHKVDPATRRYAPDLYLASFAGLAPADDPRLVIVVMIDEPRGKKYFGGQVAGPAFAEIASESLRYLGVRGKPVVAEPAPLAPEPDSASAAAPAPPTPPLEAEAEADTPDEAVPVGTRGTIVELPDFTGLTIGAALDLARIRGVRIEIEGSGRAVRQFPRPGRVLESITCRITFDPR